MHTTLTVNGRRRTVDVEPATPLLWVLRDELQLTGTKFGCGAGACGACTVHIDGAAVRSCVLPIRAVGRQNVRTIEALHDDPVGRALQAAWVRHGVAQCGYCQGGFLMAATGLLRQHPRPSVEQIGAALQNVCRCGTYPRMLAAIEDASRTLRTGAVA